MSSLVITAFLMDDENREKFATHGLMDLQVDQILDGEFRHYRNRTKRRADRLVIGRDHGGNCIVVAVEPTRTPGVWRQVTARRCSEGYETRLKKEGI